jgi:hypothetical protein
VLDPYASPDSREEMKRCERYFSSISEKLTEFVKKHNLMLDTYYHGSTSWDFHFKHPEGGVGTVSIHWLDDETIRFDSYWWVDDYEKMTRYSKFVDGDKFYLLGPSIDYYEELRKRLHLVYSWKRGEWTKVTDGYKNWHKYTKAEFEKMSLNYPEPIL